MTDNDTERSHHWRQTHEEYIPGEIQRHIDDLGLPDSVGALAEALHQQAIDADYSHRDADALASALVIAATRVQNNAISIDEITDVSRKDDKLVRSTYRSLARELDLNIRPNDPEPFIRRYADALSLPDDSTERAMRLVERAEEDGLDAGMTAQSLAATIIYIVSLSDGLDHTQADIQDATGVAESTLRNHWRDLTAELDVLITVRKGMNGHSRRSEPETFDAAWTRLEDELHPPDAVLESARQLVDAYGDRDGKAPAGIVAGAFWVAARDVQETEPREDRYIIGRMKLAHSLGVSPSTIQSRAAEFRDLL